MTNSARRSHVLQVAARPAVRIAVALALMLSAAAIFTVASGSAPADADPPPGATVIDAGCTPGGSNCTNEIMDVIENTVERPLVVTFGAGDPAGSTYNFGSAITPGADVHIQGVNQPIAALASSRMFFLAGAMNNTFSDFSIDLQDCVGVNDVFYAEDVDSFTNIEISDLNVYNGSSHNPNNTGCQFFNSGSTSSVGLTIDNVTADKVRRFVRLRTGSDHRNVVLTNNLVTELGHSALNVDGYAEDVLVEGNSFLQHAPTAKSGHMIGFQPTTSNSPGIKARNVVVRGNRVEGRPDTAHLKINGQTQPTGGAADLIAVRGIDGFIVEDNIIMHSGEVGLTATAGLTNGVIRNNMVAFTDTAGVVIGNTSAGNLPVSNIEVYGNDLFHNGLDRLNQYRSRGWAMPTISVWNAYSICIANNDIHDNSVGMGLWIYNGNNASSHWPMSVFDLYVEGNTFDNNLYDFVESDHPSATSSTHGYQPASQSGGTYWTSSWPGTDADGDGIATHCTSETDDGDPCAPDATAPACPQPPQDSDSDGIVDTLDTCPLSTGGPASNIRGCTDDDGDAFYPDTAVGDPRFDSNDADPCTPDPSGIPTGDCDNDGVPNILDACEGTAPGETVGADGCVGGPGDPPDPPDEEDVDGDGYTTFPPDVDPDDLDSCVPLNTGAECNPGPNAANEITIRARGITGVERMKMALNSSWKLTVNNVSQTMTTYTWTAPPSTNVNEVRVNFMNKGNYQGEVKKLHVDWIEIGGIRYETESPDTYMNGSIANNNTCFAPGYHQNDTLRCNGWFKYYPPSGTVIGDGAGGTTTTTSTSTTSTSSTSTTSTTSTSSTTTSSTTTSSTAAPQGSSTITIRARGVTGVERMKLALDGSYVATYTNVPTDFTEYTYTTSGPLTANEVRVNFTNKGNYQGQIKMLDVDWVEVDGVRYESEAPETWAVGSVSDSSNTCLPAGNHENDTLRCNGSFRYYLN